MGSGRDAAATVLAAVVSIAWGSRAPRAGSPRCSAREAVRGFFGEVGPGQDEAPRADGDDGLGLARIRAGRDGECFEKRVLGLDARPLLRCWSNEARALGTARDGREARPPRSAAPECGRAAVEDHGGTIAGLVEVDRLEITRHVEAEPVQDVAREDHEPRAARAPGDG